MASLPIRMLSVKGPAYAKGERQFRYAKNELEKYLKKFPNQMLSDLVKMHELCSQHGSHADFVSVMLGRYGGQIEHINRTDIVFEYFQFIEDSNKYCQFYLGILIRFLYMQELFVEFWQAAGLNHDWHTQIKKNSIR